MADHYADGTYRWWHLSRPSPELVSVLDDGWLPRAGRAVDLGSGLGSEAGYLARRLPFAGHSLDAALDRGCFHYLAPGDRPRYSAELRRVLRPGGKLLLQASLRTAGQRNDIDEAVIRDTFADWRIEHLEQAAVPSDTRLLDVLVVRLCTDQD